MSQQEHCAMMTPCRVGVCQHPPANYSIYTIFSDFRSTLSTSGVNPSMPKDPPLKLLEKQGGEDLRPSVRTYAKPKVVVRL